MPSVCVFRESWQLVSSSLYNVQSGLSARLALTCRFGPGSGAQPTTCHRSDAFLPCSALIPARGAESRSLAHDITCYCMVRNNSCRAHDAACGPPKRAEWKRWKLADSRTQCSDGRLEKHAHWTRQHRLCRSVNDGTSFQSNCSSVTLPLFIRAFPPLFTPIRSSPFHTDMFFPLIRPYPLTPSRSSPPSWSPP